MGEIEDRVEVDPLFQLLERGALRLDFEMSTHWPRMRTLMARYKQMDLADAALVCVAEREGLDTIFTVDRKDFGIYRLHGRKRFQMVGGRPRQAVAQSGRGRTQTVRRRRRRAR